MTRIFPTLPAALALPLLTALAAGGGWIDLNPLVLGIQKLHQVTEAVMAERTRVPHKYVARHAGAPRERVAVAGRR